MSRKVFMKGPSLRIRARRRSCQRDKKFKDSVLSGGENGESKRILGSEPSLKLASVYQMLELLEIIFRAGRSYACLLHSGHQLRMG